MSTSHKLKPFKIPNIDTQKIQIKGPGEGVISALSRLLFYTCLYFMSLLMIIGKDQKTPDAEEKDETTHSNFMSPRAIKCVDYLRTKGVVDYVVLQRVLLLQ